MDALDYCVELHPKKKTMDLTVQTICDVEMMNSGFYFQPKEKELIAVPYRDMGQVLRFTQALTFHLYLFRKDAAYAKAAFRKFFKVNGLEEMSQTMSKQSFTAKDSLEAEAMDKELREQIRKDDRDKLIHRD
jgi:hypothetical protein